MIQQTQTVDLFHFNELDQKAQLNAMRRMLDNHLFADIRDTMRNHALMCDEIYDRIIKMQIKFYKDGKSFRTEKNLCKEIVD